MIYQLFVFKQDLRDGNDILHYEEYDFDIEEFNQWKNEALKYAKKLDQRYIYEQEFVYILYDENSKEIDKFYFNFSTQYFFNL